MADNQIKTSKPVVFDGECFRFATDVEAPLANERTELIGRIVTLSKALHEALDAWQRCHEASSDPADGNDPRIAELRKLVTP